MNKEAAAPPGALFCLNLSERNEKGEKRREKRT